MLQRPVRGLPSAMKKSYAGRTQEGAMIISDRRSVQILPIPHSLIAGVQSAFEISLLPFINTRFAEVSETGQCPFREYITSLPTQAPYKSGDVYRMLVTGRGKIGYVMDLRVRKWPLKKAGKIPGCFSV